MATTPKLSPKQYKLLVKLGKLAFETQNMTSSQVATKYPALWKVLGNMSWHEFWYDCQLAIVGNAEKGSRMHVYVECIKNS